MYYGDKRLGMTAATKEWYQGVFERVRAQPEDFKRLRDFFNPSKHVYRVFIEVLAPESIFYTKSGELTAKLVDCSNYEKPILDSLMLKKFFSDSGNLCIDDKYVQYMESKKTPTKKYYGINVRIEIVDKPVAID